MTKDIHKAYRDPTMDAALGAVKRYEKEFKHLIYVCSPYSGEVARNVKRAKAYCRFVLRQNRIPMAPHLLYPQFMDDKDRGRIYTINEVILNKCTELWVFGDRRSPGMKKEIAYAKSKLKKIRYVTVKERA